MPRQHNRRQALRVPPHRRREASTERFDSLVLLDEHDPDVGDGFIAPCAESMEVEVGDIHDMLTVLDPDLDANRSTEHEVAGQVSFNLKNFDYWRVSRRFGLLVRLMRMVNGGFSDVGHGCSFQSVV